MGAAPRGDELPALSFFDEDDEPRRTTPRPRRARTTGGATTDSQTLLIRRVIAGVGVLLFVILLAIAVNSCRDSQRRSALEDYNRELSTIADESVSQVSVPFFETLSTGGAPTDLQAQIAQFQVVAQQQYERLESTDVPGDMRGAQQSALIALEWRRDALQRIAQQIGAALGDEGDETDAAIERIAGQMEVLLASDVAWETRVIPFVNQALEDGGVTGQEITRSAFVPALSWLQPQTIADTLDQQLSAGGDEGGGGEPTGPGLHGTNIDSTVYGDVTLQPGVANELTYVADQPFVVNFTNGGENEEFDIRVTVRIVPEGGDPITLSDTVPQLAPGEAATVELPLEEEPPLDSAVNIRTQVARVPGEDNVENNRSEYPARFTGG
jgi:hypothetical protein